MFLTIGQKLKQAREVFSIKQVQFESYGFTSAYISMIEKGVREAPKETVAEIYQALVQLTDNKIIKLFSLDVFIMTEKEQAIVWLKKHDTLEIGLSHYEHYKAVCLKYDVKHYLKNIDEKLAYHYHQQQEYDKSNDYFIRCVYYSDNEKATYFREIGMNYQKSGSYYESVLNLKLSLLHTRDDDQLLVDRNKYDLAKGHYFLDELEQSHEYINEILSECRNDKILGATILL